MAATKSNEDRPLHEQHEIERLANGYTRAQQALEFAGVSLFGGFTVYTIIHIVRAAHATSVGSAGIGLAVVAAIFGGLLFADFASGFVHWAADNWGSADWPVLGSAFIRPFRLHHLDATDITHHTFLELNGNNCIVSLPLFWVANHALNPSGSGLFWGAFWLSVAVWVMATNQFHAWAHAEQRPGWVRALQRSRLILSTPHHDLHHQTPYARNYCITNGWFNGPLRAIKFFEGLEWIMTRVTGVQANHHAIENESKNTKKTDFKAGSGTDSKRNDVRAENENTEIGAAVTSRALKTE